jgi:hypothetical protein
VGDWAVTAVDGTCCQRTATGSPAGVSAGVCVPVLLKRWSLKCGPWLGCRREECATMAFFMNTVSMAGPASAGQLSRHSAEPVSLLADRLGGGCGAVASGCGFSKVCQRVFL